MIRIMRRASSASALAAIVGTCVMPIAAHAFNPNEGADTATATRPSTARLPSTAPLLDPMPKLSFAPIQSTRQTPAENQLSPTENQPAGNSTVPPGAFIQPMPPTLEPAPVADAPQFPPVDVAVAARAQQELQSAPPIQPAPPIQGFIAPAPLLTAAPINIQRPAENPATPVNTVSAQRPIENPITASMPEPLAPANAPIVAAAPAVTAVPATPQLSDASRSILSKFPSKLNGPAAVKGNGQTLAINRLSPDIKAIATPEAKVDSYSATGLSIKVQRPGLDTNFELNRAYSALNAGDTATAIETYRNILSTEPKNEDALFGLATTYHRIGNLDQARPYYAQLLTVNPNHREGLNNFLALVSDEAPQEALAELERLEQRNPDFSPIPAQQAALLSKSGFPDQAREKMLRAIELAPDNLTYKYNLAIMLDKQGNYADASALYRLLIDASLKGQKIPAPLEAIQKRLNFIATAANSRSTLGG